MVGWAGPVTTFSTSSRAREARRAGLAVDLGRAARWVRARRTGLHCPYKVAVAGGPHAADGGCLPLTLRAKSASPRVHPPRPTVRASRRYDRDGVRTARAAIPPALRSWSLARSRSRARFARRSAISLDRESCRGFKRRLSEGWQSLSEDLPRDYAGSPIQTARPLTRCGGLCTLSCTGKPRT
jgi:hypothetical protein